MDLVDLVDTMDNATGRSRLPKRGWILAGLTVLSLMTGAASALSVGDVVFTPNSNPAVPLAGVVSFSADVPVQAFVSVSDGLSEPIVSPVSGWATAHRLLVLGLRPGRKNEIVVTITDRAGKEVAKTLEWRTDPLPDGFPPLVVKVSDREKMTPGFTLVPLFRWGAEGPDSESGLVLAIDASGDVVWYYRPDHVVSDLVPTPTGSFIYQRQRIGILNEVDVLGNVIRRWHTTGIPKDVPANSIPVDTDLFHHDHIVMPNGNIMALSTENRHYKDYLSSEEDPEAEPEDAWVTGDVIVEFAPDGTVVKEWRVLDILDPYRIGYGSLDTGFYREAYKDVWEAPAKDWAHTNSVFYDAKTNSIVCSAYRQDVVYKIDYATGELLWLLGNHDGWRRPWSTYLLEPEPDDFRWNYHQHAAKVTPHGTILMFDNGTYRARPFEEKMPNEENTSRAVEFSVNEDEKTVSSVWSFGGREDESFFSSFISDADWLADTGNVLVTSGGESIDGRRRAQIFEVTHDTPAEKVFHLVIEEEDVGWGVYRSERIPSLYPR